jgi:pentatricopeptide repeat protein
MYVKCGYVLKAREVFDSLPMKTLVAWTALISGYVQCEDGEEALKCFDQMIVDDISVDAVTYLCLLKACGAVGALSKGQEIHTEVSRAGLLDSSSNLGNALIDMYSKCGMLIKAQTIFDRLSSRDEVSWTSLIRGYAQLGASDSVFGVYERMIEEGIKPTPLTFICVLNACSHTGLVDDGQMCFKIMNANYGIIPTVEHHTCIVDLLGRAGQLECALAVTKSISTRSHDSVLWHTVLDACQKSGNLELGKHAFEQALQMDGTDSATYIFMSNMLVHTTSNQSSDVEALDVDHG